jgi:hypothetical protein
MQPVKLGMAHQPGAAALRAARPCIALQRAAVAAKTLAWIVDRIEHDCEHNENVVILCDPFGAHKAGCAEASHDIKNPAADG